MIIEHLPETGVAVEDEVRSSRAGGDFCCAGAAADALLA
jgi:hypothetical protein